MGLISLAWPWDSLITMAHAMGSDLPVNPALWSWLASGLLQIAHAAAASCSIIRFPTVGDRDRRNTGARCGRISRDHMVDHVTIR